MLKKFAKAIAEIAVLTTVFYVIIELHIGRPLVIGEVILLLATSGLIVLFISLLFRRD